MVCYGSCTVDCYLPLGTRGKRTFVGVRVSVAAAEVDHFGVVTLLCYIVCEYEYTFWGNVFLVCTEFVKVLRCPNRSIDLVSSVVFIDSTYSICSNKWMRSTSSLADAEKKDLFSIVHFSLSY